MKALRFLPIVALFIALASCNSGNSLEKYFVKKSDNPDFITLDLSSGLIKPDPKKITAEQSEALNRIAKLNILMFKRNTGNLAGYKAEKDSVKDILKGGKYVEMMKVGSGKQGFSINMKGKETDEKTDEFVVNAYSADNGFAVVRLLGDDMTLSDIMAVMSLIEGSNMDIDQLKPLQELLKKQK